MRNPLLAIVILAGLAVTPSGHGQPGPATRATGPRTHTLVIGGAVFHVEIATTPADCEHGLMDRSDIPPDGGMLFVFPEARERSFWMAHCLVDLDAIFLDADGRVVSAHEMRIEPPKRAGEAETDYRARLPLYSSGGPAQYAIELKGGTLGMLGIKPGDTVPLGDVPIPPVK